MSLIELPAPAWLWMPPGLLRPRRPRTRIWTPCIKRAAPSIVHTATPYEPGYGSASPAQLTLSGATEATIACSWRACSRGHGGFRRVWESEASRGAGPSVRLTANGGVVLRPPRTAVARGLWRIGSRRWLAAEMIDATQRQAHSIRMRSVVRPSSTMPARGERFAWAAIGVGIVPHASE